MNSTNDRILIVGWGRSGKDEAGAFMHTHLGIPYAGSTSWAALPRMAKALNLPEQLVWEQRHQYRQVWKSACDRFRADNPLLLVCLAIWGQPWPLETFPTRGRVVTGVRDKSEIDDIKAAGLFKHILWIHRPGTPEDLTVTFSCDDATDVIVNRGTLEEFHAALAEWAVEKGLAKTLSNYAKRVMIGYPSSPTTDTFRE